MRNSVALALGLLSYASAGEEGRTGLSLSEFQRVLRTGLDNELTKLTDASQHTHQRSKRTDSLPDQRNIHTKRRSNIRRRANSQDDQSTDIELPESSSSPSSSFFVEQVWDDLIEHAWNTANTIKRDEQSGMSVTTNPQEAHPSPFLVCTRGHNHDSVDDILALFDKHYDDSLVVSSTREETCLILTTTTLQAKQVVNSHEESQATSLVALPLLDISKIQAGTIDEVSSQGWSVPYHEGHQQDDNDSVPQRKNETESMNEWERMISVEFAPGLGGMKEEAQLLQVVNNLVGDIQDMAEVGWLRSMRKEESQQYLIDESLVGVPALSDLFSLTSSSLRSTNGENILQDNTRVAFWHDSFSKGIESEHACSEMFSTLFVKPRSGYYGYDLVLNPSDGPPPNEYESSASNPACVTSLLAALSTHPYVLSVKANFPIYHGWHVAQKLDSF